MEVTPTPPPAAPSTDASTAPESPDIVAAPSPDAVPSTTAPNPVASPPSEGAPSVPPSPEVASIPAPPAAEPPPLDARALAARGLQKELDGDNQGALADLRAALVVESDPERQQGIRNLLRLLDTRR